VSEAFLNGRITLHAGDCAAVIRTLPDNSIDSCVTDPPYALTSTVARYSNAKSNLEQPADKDLAGVKAGAFRRLAKGFMGKEWDTGDVAFDVDFWAEVYRVLKPGGHVAAFGGTRSVHDLAAAICGAGFEIRDQIKFDHESDTERLAFLDSLNDEQRAQFFKLFGENQQLGQLAWVYGSGFPKSHDVSKGIDKAAGAEREVVGRRTDGPSSWMLDQKIAHRESGGTGMGYADGSGKEYDITAPATDGARQWEGWGTALKPAWEPICLARKPLSEKTVAANVLRWGTGAINVDGCRVEGGERPHIERRNDKALDGDVYGSGINGSRSLGTTTAARWPANLCHDGSDEVLAAFPDSKGQQGDVSGNEPSKPIWGSAAHTTPFAKRGDSGSAARFFYSAKADADDRLGSKHPTVKPVDLMQWLCRLITPPDGVVLDPFAGSGTTGEAAWREGFSAILIEREEEYLTDIRRRMELTSAGPRERKTASIKAKKDTEDPGPMFALLRAAE